MKKIISIILILLLVGLPFSFLLNVKAADVEFILSDSITKKDDPNSKLITNNDVTITVSNFSDSSTANVSSYKIVDVFYNEGTNEVSYQFTDEFQSFLDSDETYKELTVDRYFALTSDNPDGTASDSVITTSTLNMLLSKFLINDNSSSDVVFTRSGNAQDGYVASATVEAGVYVLEVLGIREIYGVMVANAVPIVDKNGEWVITNPEIVAKKSEVSNQSLTITKQVVNIEEMLMSFDIEYKLTIPELPSNAIDEERKKEFSFFVSKSDYTALSMLTLKNGETLLTVDENGQVYNGDELVENIVVESSVVQVKDITKLTNRNFTITYTCDIPLYEVYYGEEGNTFMAVTSYDPHQYTENGYTGSSIINVSAYAYAVAIQNLEKNTSDVTLSGAEYEVYKSYNAETNTLSDKVDVEFAMVDGNLMFVVTESGNYYVKQIKAPSGYNLSKDIIDIDVREGSDNEVSRGTYFGLIYNEKLWFLPSTGGIGTVIYTLVGLSVVAISTYGIVYYRKKRISNI